MYAILCRKSKIVFFDSPLGFPLVIIQKNLSEKKMNLYIENKNHYEILTGNDKDLFFTCRENDRGSQIYQRLQVDAKSTVGHKDKSSGQEWSGNGVKAYGKPLHEDDFAVKYINGNKDVRLHVVALDGTRTFKYINSIEESFFPDKEGSKWMRSYEAQGYCQNLAASIPAESSIFDTIGDIADEEPVAYAKP
jgi:hypothetical protein